MTKANEAALRIKEFLDLKLEIQAVKLIEDPSEVPENAVNAHKEYGHLSLCQAFALTKRHGITLYTDKSSEWCWAPVVGLGYAETGPGTPCFNTISRLLGIQDPERAHKFFADFPRLPVCRRLSSAPVSSMKAFHSAKLPKAALSSCRTSRVSSAAAACAPCSDFSQAS